MSRNVSGRRQQRRRHRSCGLIQHTSFPLSVSEDEVLTFAQWCTLNKIAERTGRRILAGPGGPTVTMLSARRIGIRIGDNRRWQQSRAR